MSRKSKKPDPRILRTRPELGGLIIDDANYADIVKWAGEPESLLNKRVVYRRGAREVLYEKAGSVIALDEDPLLVRVRFDTAGELLCLVTNLDPETPRP